MADVTTYAAFLENKRRQVQPAGRAVDPGEVNPLLHSWQQRVVQWAVRTGRNAVWADTGTGKTFMQLEYARLSGCRALIIAPLAVCHQTVREAAKLGIKARYVKTGDEADGPGIWVTNYERALRFDPAALDAVVLDEASILKQSDGKTRTALIKHFAEVKHRQACTATPAPNDNEELTSQAEFVGVMPRVEMLAAYFVHDDEGWRVKGHARGPMFRWMATWAVALRRPSDIGGDDTGYILPGLDIIPHLLPVDVTPDGQLFATDLGGVGGRAKIRKATLDARTARTAELAAAEPGEPWVIWCGLNAEADTVARLIPGAVNVHGAMTPEEKAEALLGFADGEHPGDRHEAVDRVVRDELAALRPDGVLRARRLLRAVLPGDPPLLPVRPDPRACTPTSSCPSWRGRSRRTWPARRSRPPQMTEELVREMRAAGELEMR